MNTSTLQHQPTALTPLRPVTAWTFFFIAALLGGNVAPVLAQSWNRPTASSPIAININDRLIWAVNPADDSVSVIRPDTNTRLAKIPVGDEPQSIALTPNNQYAYVANAAGNSVSIIQINDPAWGTFSASVVATLTTGAEPWNVVCSPNGLRVFVANSAQDTITVINAATRSIIGHVDLRNSLANDPDRCRHFQPRGLAVSLDNTKLYVTRFLSFTRPGGRQGDDFGKEGLVAVLDINTASANIADYSVARVVTLAPQISGFRFPGLTNAPTLDTAAFPNQMQSIVLRGDQAYLPNIAASPSGPLRFNLDTHAFVSVIDGVNGTTPVDAGTSKFLNLHLGARDPEPPKRRVFFANPWDIAFTTQTGGGQAYVVSAASDVLVKLNVAADGKLSFTGDGDTTRYIDLNDPTNPATSGANAGKNPQGIAITSSGGLAYVANFVSRNVSVVNLTNDAVIAVVSTADLPVPGSQGETNLVGAEMFFSSRGNFDTIPGTNSLRDRLSSEGWQSCASCHFKGLTDGVIWQFNAGPRKSVPLNSSFNPHDRSQQRVLNYSAIFDEIEDFEANIRNISGPGPLAGGALDPNHGLLIGDSGDLNVAPSALNAFALPNAGRAQVSVTPPNSPNRVPALTALREWVRFAVRTPNSPLSGLPNGPSAPDLAAGRSLFIQGGCAQCHGGQNWTLSLKDFTSPPAAAEIFTERNPTNFTGNPVGAQYLNRFLRDIGSFNLGVPGQGNPFGNNIGADEKAAAGVANGTLLAAQDALGRDYNSDGKGTGFNVPSLLGMFALPPYLHNGAAECLAAVVADVKHRTDNGRLPDRLSNPADQAKVVQFLESVDSATAAVLDIGDRPTTSSPIAINPTDRLIWVVNPSDDSVAVIRPDNNTRLAKIAVGDEPQSIALTPDNQYAYVANAAGSSVSIIQINDPAWGTFSASVVATLPTGAEPWNVVCSPNGARVFVANSGQDTITVINTANRQVIGHVDLRNSLANDPDRSRHFQPRGLAVTADNSKLYVTRFLSFTKPGGRQGDDLGREGLVAVLDISTSSQNISDYRPVRTVALTPQITGFKFPGLTNPPAPDTFAFPNQMQSIVLRGESAYLPNIAASPSGPLRFNLDTHAFVTRIAGANSTTPVDRGALNLHLGARNPEPTKRRVFFANPWAIAFTSQIGEGTAYAISAASDVLVKLNVGADGRLVFTGDEDTTRYIDLNDPNDAATRGTNAGKNPQGLAINSTGTRAYVANFVSRNVSVIDLASDTVIAVVPTSDLPAPGSTGETNLVGAEMFFSSRGVFDAIPGTNSLRDRLSSEGWQSCASCHFKGLTDGVVWQFNAGPRKSVPLNATFNPHNRTQQRLLNYSAIFDEVEDFEINIRNVSGPGPLAGGALDPNHGLLIGDANDLNVAPSALNAFALANANRPQVTVTLPGSANRVPALTALREWVRNAVRTPNAPRPGYGGYDATPGELLHGRSLFLQAGCASCHGGQNWTISLKDFTSPPAGAELTTERVPATFTGNPVGAQYLNRFLRDIGSFNIGVPGLENPLGNDIGADEKAAAAVANGTLQPAQDALGIDYNNDGKGAGFNVPSLLGLNNLPPYLHNGAAESLVTVLADANHRTDNGRLTDVLYDPADQALVAKFLESIDFNTVPFVPLTLQQAGSQWVVSFDSVAGVRYAIEGTSSLGSAFAVIVSPILGTGQRIEVPLTLQTAYAFLRLVEAP
jgi:YVTN family beta-propeller protein